MILAEVQANLGTQNRLVPSCGEYGMKLELFYLDKVSLIKT